MKPHLNFQLCIHPFWDGGFYVNGNKQMRMIRFGLGLLDFRVWWVAAPNPMLAGNR